MPRDEIMAWCYIALGVLSFAIAGVLTYKWTRPTPLAPELAGRIREALAVLGRPGFRVIAKQFGVSLMTVQNVSRA